MRLVSFRVFDSCVAIFFLAAIYLAHPGATFASISLFTYYVVRAYLSRDSPELSILLLFGSSYPLMWMISVILDVDIHYLSWNIDDVHVATAFAIQGLFMACLLLAAGHRMPRTVAEFPRRDDVLIFGASLLCIVAMPIIGLVTSSGSSIFDQSYDFAGDSSSILFEYVLIPVLIAYVYSGDSIVRTRLLIAGATVAIVAPILVGRRLPATMIALAMLFLYFRPRKFWQQLLVVLVAFFSLSLIALFRLGASADSITRVAFNIGNNGAMANNQGGVVYVAGVYMKLSQEGVFDAEFGMDSFLNVLASILLPSSAVGDSAYINLVAADYIPIPGNGGFPGVHFYVWGGIFFVTLSGLVLGSIIRESSTYLTAAVYATFLFSTFPRWMSYNVNILFKMGTLLMVAWMVTVILHRAAVVARERYSPRQSGRSQRHGASPGRHLYLLSPK